MTNIETPVTTAEAENRLTPEMESIIAEHALRPPHRVILLLMINGLKHVDIARFLGITPNTVGNVWRDANFRECFDRIDALRTAKASDSTSIVRRGFVTKSIRAQEYLAELMEDDTQKASDRRQAAHDILDYAGHKPVDRFDVNAVTHTTLEIKDSSYDKSNDPYYQNLARLGRAPEDELLEENAAAEELDRLEESLQKGESDDVTSFNA